MKYLALALLLCTQLHLLHGACFVPSLALSKDIPGCVDKDGTVHPFGSTWRTSDCQDCTCSGCCDAYVRPGSFPEDCTMEFDNNKCEYKVFKKNDPTVPCPIFGAVGK